ncbi:MAG: vitamin B12 dependent-methionine synthase activation domain-containing protein [Candidatus Bipolaricaulia bacterium]
MRILNPPRLEVELNQIWQRLEYDDPAQASTLIQQAFMQAAEIGQGLLEPTACYDIHPIEVITPSSVQLQGISFESRELVARCRGAEELVAFIVTIGPRLEERVKQLLPTEPTVAFILDSYGSEAVVALARRVRAAIHEYADSKGYRVGERYCPGYGDWDTKEQQKLFSLLEGDRIGVKLGPGFMMFPRKSYAGVLPLGPEVLEVRPDERCCRG